MSLPMNLVVPVVVSGLASAAIAVAVTVQVVAPAPAAPAPVAATPPQQVACPDDRASRDEEQWRADMLRGGIPPAARYRHVPAP